MVMSQRPSTEEVSGDAFKVFARNKLIRMIIEYNNSFLAWQLILVFFLSIEFS